MNAEQARIPVEISSRLLSEQVRYDGDTKSTPIQSISCVPILSSRGFVLSRR